MFSIGLYAPLYWPYMFQLVCVERGLSALQFGTLKSIYYTSVILLELPGGLFADHFGRRTGLAACAGLNALACFMYAQAGDFWTLALAEVAMASGTALLSGADSALLFDSLRAEGREQDYTHAEGQMRSTPFVASTIGLLIADFWLVPRGGAELTYTATGWLSLLGLGAALLLREPERTQSGSIRQLWRGALHDVLARPRVLQILAFTTGLYILARAANAALYHPVLANAGVPLERYGTITVCLAAAGAYCAWRSSRLLARFGRRALLMVLPAVACALYLGMALGRGYWMGAVMALQGVLVSVTSVVTAVALNAESSASQHRATLLSFQSIAWRGGYALAAPLIGICIDRLPLRGAIAATAAIGGAFLGLAWLLRRVRKPAAAVGEPTILRDPL